MELVRKRKKLANIASIADLPEQVLREIFRYLDDETVYLTIRKISQKLKIYVDRYLELSGEFIITDVRYEQTMLLYITKRYGKELKSYTIRVPDVVYPCISHGWKLPNKIRQFCTVVLNKLLFCAYQPVFSVSLDGFGYYNGNCRYMRTYDDLNSYGFKQKIAKKSWESHENVMFCNKKHGENWRLTTHPELASFYSDTELSITFLNVIYFNIDNKKATNSRLSLCTYFIDIPPQLKSWIDFTLVRVGPRKILYVGGHNRQSFPNQDKTYHIHKMVLHRYVN